MDIKRKKALADIILSAISKVPKKVLFYPLRFLFSFLLSRAIILGGYAPFGLAASAALGTGKYGIWGLSGTVLGYLTVFDYINSLKYIACLILIFTANLVFEGTDLAKKRFFTPLSVIVPMFCIHFVFLASDGFEMLDVLLAFLEITIAAYSSIAFKRLCRTSAYRPKEFAPYLLCAVCAIIVALCDFTFGSVFSVGRALAFVIVFFCMFSGGIGAGAVSGTLIGFAVSLKYLSADYCMIYGICGILGALPKRNGPLSILTACASALLVSLFLDPTSFLPRVLELIFASGIFLLFADTFLRHTRKFFSFSSTRNDRHIREYAANRLNLVSKAFGNISRTLEENSPPKNEDLPDASMFEKSCAHLCRKCSLLNICWQRDFESTRDALNNASQKAKRNGMVTAQDFPIYFSSRCLHIEKFVGNINREIVSRKYHTDFSKKLSSSKNLIRKQYSDASLIFSKFASDIMNSTSFDESAECEIHSILTSNGIHCDSAVWRDSERHINLHFCGPDLRSIAEEYNRLRPLFEEVLKVKLNAPAYTKGEHEEEIIIREKPFLRGVFAASTLNKNASGTSGDSGSFFSPANGKLALLLSDGMGSGKSAGKISAKSVLLLESLLNSGFPPENALSTLHSALTLKTEETGAFSTLDLFYADMFTGNASFYKLGAAPTYIKRGDKVKRISCSCLPAGVSISGDFDMSREDVKLSENDFVIMVSDGICDCDDEEKLLQFISKSNETSPKALADTIVAFSARSHGKNDDMTVAVVLIEGNHNE